MSDVVVGFVAGDSVLTRFTSSLLSMMRYDQAHRQLTGHSDYIIEEGCFIDNNREAMAHEFLKTNSEWLFTIDTDIEFAPDLLDLMLDSAESVSAKIFSAFYVTWMGDGTQLCPVWMINLAPGDKHVFQTVSTLYPYPQEVDAIGMGAALIHRSVFETMKDAYEQGRASWSASPWIWFGRDLIISEKGRTAMGEDVSFCRRAKECGFKIWGDSRIQVRHRKRSPLDYEALLDANLVRRAKLELAQQKDAA